ncbi:MULTISPECIES: hypothetical protein [unclassified Okeania]|uniref:hypothetical protein n=1 Tax=unclassified Okeania TaxID=2634635 RepID=UPI0013BD72C5|nr:MULTISPECIES: hypothetical protein [unclassified Okeania]NES77096.1 hypothetical protein [Okeania sp. SIO1H4]NET15654.1 hypothetical protein [Okeania sp. SIO1H6]NET21411.1 hypothetical protein [Okeania sp. SIO1H5]NET93925.1 hypothetical protein [Okeania sp. SIO1H2]
MQNNNRNIASVWDMVQAIRRIQEFTTDLKKETGDRRQETGGKLHGDSNPK